MSLTVMVLTRDEAKHIVRCLASVAGLAARVVVIDSESTDATCALARDAGADVLVNPWTTHAGQFNWGLDNAAITTDWIMRLDADEVVLPNLRAALAAFIIMPGDAAAATVNRQIHFLGRWMRRGGIYPIRQLRIWRTGCGRCEDRWMDEHILVDGPIQHLNADLADINLNTLGWWITKHNNYATLEVADVLLNPVTDAPEGLATRTLVKRWLKVNLYERAPHGFRALAFFLYRYVVLLGFLDGRQGLIFHVLQGFWYRFLVDAKLYEVRQRMAATGESARTILTRDNKLAVPAEG